MTTDFGGPVTLFIALVYIAIIIVPFWRIYGRAGFSPWLALLMLVPLVNLIMLYILAFAEWPALKRPS